MKIQWSLPLGEIALKVCTCNQQSNVCRGGGLVHQISDLWPPEARVVIVNV